MGAFYGNKIKFGEINAKTGEVWTFADVPSLWKTKAKKWLEVN